jgi:hypothetical protein
MDVDSIPAGQDFVEAIQGMIGSCDAVLVVMGRNWLHAVDLEGRRRLEDPNDVVVQEIAAALAQKIRVIPVLVGGASMPVEQQVPNSVAPLCRRNAFEIGDGRFTSDVDRLVETLRSPVAASTLAGPRVRYRRAIQVLGTFQMAGGWAAFFLSLDGNRPAGDDDLLLVWILLWITGGVLIELSRRSRVRDGIFLGVAVPLALLIEMALEYPTGYSGALGLSHWQLLQWLSLSSALLGTVFYLRTLLKLAGRAMFLPRLPWAVLVMIVLLWLLTRFL